MPKFIDRTGEVKYNNQGEKMVIIEYKKAIDIDIQFEDGSIVYSKSYASFKKGSIKHPIRYEESFAYHIEVKLNLDLDDIWNWEKNNKNGINPYEIYKCSNKKVWLYCLEKDYHNYDRKCKIKKIIEDYNLADENGKQPSCNTIWYAIHKGDLWSTIL